MKINLKNFIDENERADELRKQARKITDLNKMIASIITNNDYFYCDDEELLKEMKLSYKKNDSYLGTFTRYYVPCYEGKFKVKLTQKNIKAVQDYIDKKE